MPKNVVTYGANSNRRVDKDSGYLYVTDCILTSAEVSQYLGSEIAGYQALGLDANTPYGILRPLSEIKKAAETYNGLPFLDIHVPVTSDKPQQSEWIGCIGTEARVEGNDLLNTVVAWKQTAIDNIQLADKNAGGKKDLSCGYAYELEKSEGVFEGVPYQFKMVNLRGNHVALVDNGRVEKAMIADNNIILKGKTMKKSAVSMLLSSLFGDKKAMDNDYLIKGIKALCDKSPEDFEGGEAEQAKAVMDMARKMGDSSEKTSEVKEVSAKNTKEVGDKKGKDEDDDTEEEMEDSEEELKEKAEKLKDKKAKDKKAHDNEKEEKEEKKEAMDSAIKKGIQSAIAEKSKIEALCNKIIGRISPKLLMDSSSESLLDATLKAKGLSIENKSYETKLAMAETLATMNDSNSQVIKPKTANALKFVSPLTRK